MKTESMGLISELLIAAADIGIAVLVAVSLPASATRA